MKRSIESANFQQDFNLLRKVLWRKMLKYLLFFKSNILKSQKLFKLVSLDKRRRHAGYTSPSNLLMADYQLTKNVACLFQFLQIWALHLTISLKNVSSNILMMQIWFQQNLIIQENFQKYFTFHHFFSV